MAVDQNELTRLERLCASDRLRPGDAARLLDLRGLALSAVASHEAPAESPVEIVAFRAGAGRFGVASTAVVQVRDLGKIAALPGAPPVVCGVIVHRAALVAVADLALFFDGQASARALGSRIVVLEMERHQMALLVNELLGVRTLDRASLVSSPSTFPPDLTRFVEGVAPDGLALLSARALLFDLLAI